MSKWWSTPSSSAMRRNTPSAIGDRQILQGQTRRGRDLAMPGQMACARAPRKAASRGGSPRLHRLGADLIFGSRASLSCEVRTMVAWNEASDLKHAALGREISLAAFAEKERKVRRDFWAKLKRFAGMVPFVEDLVAAYYCALDPATPMRVRGMLLAAIAYFILP